MFFVVLFFIALGVAAVFLYHKAPNAIEKAILIGSAILGVSFSIIILTLPNDAQFIGNNFDLTWLEGLLVSQDELWDLWRYGYPPIISVIFRVGASVVLLGILFLLTCKPKVTQFQTKLLATVALVVFAFEMMPIEYGHWYELFANGYVFEWLGHGDGTAWLGICVLLTPLVLLGFGISIWFFRNKKWGVVTRVLYIWLCFVPVFSATIWPDSIYDFCRFVFSALCLSMIMILMSKRRNREIINKVKRQGGDIAQQLLLLKQQHENGQISDEDYKTQKEQLIKTL